jgi:hypothetical protein
MDEEFVNGCTNSLTIDVTDARLFASESLIIRCDKMVSHGLLCA